jgi:hypothetical protein
MTGRATAHAHMLQMSAEAGLELEISATSDAEQLLLAGLLIITRVITCDNHESRQASAEQAITKGDGK